MEIENEETNEIQNDVDIDIENVPVQYKEKKWGKYEDGLYVIDGYTFRGKQSFLKVIEGFKQLMKKGKENSLDEI